MTLVTSQSRVRDRPHAVPSKIFIASRPHTTPTIATPFASMHPIRSTVGPQGPTFEPWLRLRGQKYAGTAYLSVLARVAVPHGGRRSISMTFVFASHGMYDLHDCEYKYDAYTRFTSRLVPALHLLSSRAPVKMLLIYSLAAFLTIISSCSAASIFQRASPVVNQTTCDGKQFTYQYLAGYGFIPSNARDKYGDTIGGIGSSIALDRSSWKKKSKRGNTYYTGILWVLPDRGWYIVPLFLPTTSSPLHSLLLSLPYISPLDKARSPPPLFHRNTQGTTNFQNRIHKLGVTFTLNASATASSPSPPNLQLKYLDTVLLSGPDGTPTTGLDADITGYLSIPGFPPLPAATYVGDGFGGNGTGGRRISIDAGMFDFRDISFFMERWTGRQYFVLVG